MRIRLDPDLENLFPIDDEVYEKLKEDIKQNGIIHPIIVAQDGTLVSGYTRYKIAKELGINPPIEVRHFKDKQEMILFAVRDNILRRQLNTYQKALIGLKLLEYERKEAKKRQGTRTDLMDETSLKNFKEVAGTAAEKAAKVVGVSHTTLYKVYKIEKYAPDEIKTKARKGEISIEDALSRAVMAKYEERLEKLRHEQEILKERLRKSGGIQKIKLVLKPQKMNDKWYIKAEVPEEWASGVKITIESLRKPVGFYKLKEVQEKINQTLREIEAEKIMDEAERLEYACILHRRNVVKLSSCRLLVWHKDRKKIKELYERICNFVDNENLPLGRRGKIIIEPLLPTKDRPFWGLNFQFRTKKKTEEKIRSWLKGVLDELNIRDETAEVIDKVRYPRDYKPLF